MKTNSRLVGWMAVGTMLLVVGCGGKNAEPEGAGGSDQYGGESATEQGGSQASGGSKAWGTGGTAQAGARAGNEQTEVTGGTGQVGTAGSGWGGTDSTPSWGGTDSTPSWGDGGQGDTQGGTYYTAGAGGGGGSPVDAARLCADENKNGWESDIDCGGPDCAACPAASSCTQHKDCKSGVCRAMTCQSPSCDDEVKNGSEAGVDCGGSCEPCP